MSSHEEATGSPSHAPKSANWQKLWIVEIPKQRTPRAHNAGVDSIGVLPSLQARWGREFTELRNNHRQRPLWTVCDGGVIDNQPPKLIERGAYTLFRDYQEGDDQRVFTDKLEAVAFMHAELDRQIDQLHKAVEARLEWAKEIDRVHRIPKRGDLCECTIVSTTGVGVLAVGYATDFAAYPGMGRVVLMQVHSFLVPSQDGQSWHEVAPDLARQGEDDGEGYGVTCVPEDAVQWGDFKRRVTVQPT